MKLYRRTTLIAVFCLSVLGGLGLSRRISFMPSWGLVVVISPLLLVLRHKNLLTLYLVILLGLGIGIARGSVYSHKLQDLQSLLGHRVALTGTVTTDAVYDKNRQLSFDMRGMRHADSTKPVIGNFKVSGFGLPMVYRGDKVKVSGKLFLTRGSRQAGVSYAQLSLVGQDTNPVNKLTRQFNAGMQNALPEPLASFGLGLLIGQRSTLPQSIISQLTAVGLIHIVAVSGYNVTILARAIARLKLGSRYQRLVLSLALIGLFVMVTGFSASIVRAAFVSCLSLLAWFYGRSIRPIVLIAFVAAVTGLLNPFYVWGDLGWYLSFLAFFGILVVAPMIQKRLFNRQPRLMLVVLLETLSAELMTLPLILTYFSQLSLVAPLANLLVVPLVPLAMLLAAIAGTAGAIAPTLAGWLAWPAKILLTYMLDIAHMLASIPASFIKVSAGVGVMITFYALVVFVGVAVRRGIRRQTNTLDMLE